MAQGLCFLFDRPEEVPVDPITDLFTLLHVKNVTYKRLDVTAPWGLNLGCYQDAKFGMVIHGMCWITSDLENAEPLLLNEGDCYIVPHGTPYRLHDSPATPARDLLEVVKEQKGESIVYGGGGTSATLICGRFLFDEAGRLSLTSLLPPFLHIPTSQERASALRTTQQLLTAEMLSSDLGTQVVVNRLADVFFVQAARTYIASNEHGAPGWLAAMADPAMGKVLTAMHRQIEYPWTVERLAQTIGWSRSAFALRFKQLVGESPMEYMTRWRMYKASSLLREQEKNLVWVANMVGYDSD